ncbi:hypothetical protein SUGI_0610840 [Cryptomeria japonica]|nr:hypothetical protein SUGI_0610840 [Cryptomeria japonica]
MGVSCLGTASLSCLSSFFLMALVEAYNFNRPRRKPCYLANASRGAASANTKSNSKEASIFLDAVHY